MNYKGRTIETPSLQPVDELGTAVFPVRQGEATVVQQARTLTSLLLGLVRQLLAVDDLISELPLRQLRICGILYEAPRSMSQISREIGISLSAMTQIADRLEESGFVKRHFQDTDRRVRYLKLTTRGEKMMRVREEIRHKRMRELLERLSEPERAGALVAMQTMLKACESSTTEEGAV